MVRVKEVDRHGAEAGRNHVGDPENRACQSDILPSNGAGPQEIPEQYFSVRSTRREEGQNRRISAYLLGGRIEVLLTFDVDSVHLVIKWLLTLLLVNALD